MQRVKRVGVSFDGWRGMEEKRTDSNGETHFDNDLGNGKIFMDGRTQFVGRIQGLQRVYI
jgi:hypothetical protein